MRYIYPAVTSRMLVIMMLIGALITAPLLFFQNDVSAVACTPPATDYGRVTTSANVPSAATYRVWTRMQIPSSTNSTYLLELDGNKCYTVGGAGISANVWTWVSFQNGNQSSRIDVPLTAGAHSMKMIGDKPGVKVDRVVFVSDPNCIPTGLGDNCNVPDDTTAPTTNLTAPTASASVSGSAVAISATVTDAGGVSRAEFYADGLSIASDTSAPYATTWDSTKLANGVHTLSVRGYDLSGNMSASTASVTVKNGDFQEPTTPLNLSAKAISATKVQFSWSASVDNIGVTGYTVYRNSLPVAKVTESTTLYEDTSVAPQTSYSYQVEAFDLAGNRSPLSPTATIVTPAVPDTQPPSQPQGLVGSSAGTSQINLSWSWSTDNVAVTFYDIYRTSLGQTPTKIASITTNTYGDTGLADNTSYTYYVIARDASANISTKSATVTVTTAAEVADLWRISGIVTNAKDSPLADVRISVMIDGVKNITQTNQSGWYAFRTLPNGTYSLTAYKEGFKSVTKKVIVKNDDALKQNFTLQRR